VRTHFKAEETNKLAFVENIYSNVLSFQVRHDLVTRKNKTKWGNRDIETPAAAEHNKHETDFEFNSNVLATQLGGVSNSSRGEKSINTPCHDSALPLLKAGSRQKHSSLEEART
jgi:hypothetical protein